MEPQTIEIRHAREHNLRSVSLSLPRNALIVFTGVSGSGKSSLAFDTLYAEGQRRYIESLSSYARQFMGQLQKPDCDLITGLSPSIAIQQKTTGWNPRSTVATITGIHDFLRVLYARVGVQHCTECGRPIAAQSREQIVEGILRAFAADPNRDRTGAGDPSRDREGAVDPSRERQRPENPSPERQRPASSRASGDAPPPRNAASRILVLAPVARSQKGEFRDLFDDLIRDGYVRARADGRIVELRENLALEKNQRHDIEVVIDRLIAAPQARSRLAEAVENALRVGRGTLIVAEDSPAAGGGVATADEKLFSSKYACAECDVSYEPPTPQLLSFNSPTGMCETCDGLGELLDFDPDLLVPDPSLNFWAPCIAPMRVKIGRWRRHIYEGVARAVGIDLSRPWKDLPPKARDALLYGTGERHITFEWRWSGGVWKHGDTFDGIIEELRAKYRKAKSSFVRAYYEKYMQRGPCPDCRGARLNSQALGVRLPVAKTESPEHRSTGPFSRKPKASEFGERGPNIGEFCRMSVQAAHDFLGRLALTPVQQIIVEDVLKEIRARLEFLLRVGLHYLTLERTAPTLAGGELQRIRLAGQIGSGLVGVLYILDEPSIGLHARDNQRLLDSLRELRDMGNTVIVVEHDEATMRAADHLVDFGPGPGVRGGKVVAEGSFDEVVRNKDSLTARYLTGAEEIPVPKRRPVHSNRPRR
jgi:excinuclease ABC subunit A